MSATNSDNAEQTRDEMLAAGAVLPTGTDQPGERVVPLTARSYRHPVLDDRVVVRLIPAELGVGEDMAVGFLGLELAGDPAEVGLGLRQALGFPEWVLVHHPDDGHRALAIMPELRRIAKLAKSKPKFAADDYHKLGGELARAVPHFLPTFYEQAARVFLGVDQDSFAGQMFNRARKAEAEHGLAVDPDRLDAVYLEFALAGALPATTLAGYAKDLAAHLPAEAALDRFCRLSVRSTAAGLVPSLQTANAVRRLVRAAAKSGSAADAEAREQAYLVEMLGLSKVQDAPAGWWKVHRPAVVATAQRDPAVRGQLLNVLPDAAGEVDVLVRWLDLLAETGATAGLTEADVPAAARPADGAIGWLNRFLRDRPRSYDRSVSDRLPPLYELVRRMVDRLRAEAAETDATIKPGEDLDLLDLLLSLGLPVYDQNNRLDLERWARGEGQRDLLAVAGDPRFRSAFHNTVQGMSGNSDDQRALRRLAGVPGGRAMLTDWLREQAASIGDSGLPNLAAEIGRLTWLPDEVLALATDEVAAVTGIDLAEEIARSLRGGILDELGWPAWDEAVADVIDLKKRTGFVVADAWPYLIVAGPTRVRVIDADGTVLCHDLRIPAGDVWGEPGFHYVDGELLVYWDSRDLGGHLRGYWHSSADAPQPLGGDRSRNQPRTGTVTLPVPGGGRTTGDGVLHVGDTVVPDEKPLIGDGTSYWVYRRGDGKGDGYGWHGYDPASNAYGPRSLPGFLADALRTAPAGSTLRERSSWVLPTRSDRVTPAGAPVDGLIGWRVVELPDGSMRGEDLAGRTVISARGVPIGAVTLPGDDRPRALLEDMSLVDPDGIVSAAAGSQGTTKDYTPDAMPMPRRRYFQHLLPRDPQGSTALRRFDRDTAAALLKGAGTPDDLPALVRATLPQITHEAVLAGVVGVVTFAAARQESLDKLAERLAGPLAAGTATEPVNAPTELELDAALRGLDVTGHYYSYHSGEPVRAFRQFRLIGDARQAAPSTADPAAPPIRLHLDGPRFVDSAVSWYRLLDQPAAVAFRAATEITAPADRATLDALLTELDRLDLATATEPARWRRFTLRLDDQQLKTPDGAWRDFHQGGLLPLDGGAFLAVLSADSHASGADFTTLYHDPAGAFAVPAPYTMVSSAPVGAARPAGWLTTFRTELAARGPIPWRPELVEAFIAHTGVTPTVAKLVLAGLPEGSNASSLPADVRKTLKIKTTEVNLAQETLHGIDIDTRRAVVGALLPDDPTRLWTDGPDVAAAAAAWNAVVRRRPAVPEQLLIDATRAVQVSWGPESALPALLDPADSPELANDLAWAVSGDRISPVGDSGPGFTANVLIGAVTTAAWTAHHTPAGDPVRAALPIALAAIQDRLSHPDLVLDLHRYVRLSTFRKVAGSPSETGAGWERYGAIILATADDQPSPGIRVALLDSTGDDPYLPALRGERQALFPAEAALRTARDPRFAALLADPGDPVAGERGPDGTWWPQDPSRSVPELVAEVTDAYGLGADAATVYLMLLAMPDPTDRNVARWTGWKPARLKAARAELAGTDLVIEASRSQAGRSLFLPCAWLEKDSPRLPVERWKLPLFELPGSGAALAAVRVPLEPVPDLYRRAWQRLRDGDVPRLEELQTRRGTRR